MFLHHIDEISYPIGIQRVHIAFGRFQYSTKNILYHKKTISITTQNKFHHSSNIYNRIVLVVAALSKIISSAICNNSYLKTPPPYHHINNLGFSNGFIFRIVVAFFKFNCIVAVFLFCIIDRANKLVVCVCVLLIIVQALYEGTLVTSRTTAQTVHRRCCWNSTAQLAAFSLFLATLTLAARCYASTSNATHPLVQLTPTKPTNPALSPIYNSNSQSSSNLVLSSRLFTTPYQLVQSDTSLILTNSKVLLYNQNFIHYWRAPTTKKARTKREFKTNNYTNRIVNLKNTKIEDNNNSIQQQQKIRERTRPVLTIRRRTSNSSNSKTNELDLGVIPNINVVSRTLTNSDDRVHNSKKKINNSTAVTIDTTIEQHQQQNDSGFQEDTSHVQEEDQTYSRSTARSMPPVNVHNNESSGTVSEWSLILVVLIVLTGAAFGLVTCLLNNHQEGTGGARDGAAAATTPASNPHITAETLTTAPMLSVVSAGAAAGMGGMDRLRGGRAARDLAATRDRQVRLHAVHTDIAINLPPSIAMPDGEEHPFTTSRLHLRDPEQESEIYQKCIRPPPNRTVLESESPPPYRSSSAGVLASSSSSSCSSSSSSDWSAGSAPLVVRCHSMSSTSKPTSSTSNPHHPHHAGGQKTDFLQRTVKIFTGKKTQQQPPPPAPTLPIVIVPSSATSSISSSSLSASSRQTNNRRTTTTTTTDINTSRPKPPPGGV